MFEIDLAKGTFHEVKQTREGGNMNYTKGEWITIKSEIGYTVVELQNKNLVCNCYNEANAHLISAAPEMYEALKDLMFQFAVAVEQPHSVDTRIYNQAEQALAKAEGREE